MLDFLFKVVVYLVIVGFVSQYAMIGIEVVACAIEELWNIICWVSRKLGGKKWK